MLSFSDIRSADARLNAIERSLASKKMRVKSSDFNNVSDYLLVKRFLKRITDVKREGNYVVAKFIVKVPYTSLRVLEYNRDWLIGRGITLEEKDGYYILRVPRLLIIGCDENGKLFTVVSDTIHSWERLNEEDVRRVVFHFDEDLSHYDSIIFDNENLFDKTIRIQGDICVRVSRREFVESDYKSSLIRESHEQLQRVLLREIALRIADALAELGLNVELDRHNVIIEGAPRNINEDRLFNYLFDKLITSDIFPRFERKPLVGEYVYSIVFDNGDYRFIMDITMSYNRRSFNNPEAFLMITPRIDFSWRDTISPTLVFGSEIMKEVNVEEIEQQERIGRHVVHIERAYPRRIMVEHEFTLSGRRYHIPLSVPEYFTSGTIVELSHPQHGTKKLVMKSASFMFSHVNSPYRTNAMKNCLILSEHFK